MKSIQIHLEGSYLVANEFKLSTAKIDQKVPELQAAREILAEVFGINLSEIDEMLRQRYEGSAKSCTSYSCKRQKHLLLKHRFNESGDWPVEFCLAV